MLARVSASKTSFLPDHCTILRSRSAPAGCTVTHNDEMEERGQVRRGREGRGAAVISAHSLRHHALSLFLLLECPASNSICALSCSSLHWRWLSRRLLDRRPFLTDRMVRQQRQLTAFASTSYNSHQLGVLFISISRLADWSPRRCSDCGQWNRRERERETVPLLVTH
jgi:hypothetical protein